MEGEPKNPYAPGYGNSTHSLTLEAIKVALTKGQTRNTNLSNKEDKGT